MWFRFRFGFLCSVVMSVLLGFCGVMNAEDAVSRMAKLILDVSPSMDGPKLQAAKEGAKLAVAMLEDETTVQIVAFNDQATVSPRFPLTTATEREQVWRWIDELRTSGGTDYLKALQATTFDRDDALIFLSDGAPSNSPDDVLRFVKAKCPAKLHVVAVGCERGSSAEKLLSQMATATKGSFTRVDGSEDLVRTLVKIAARVGKYYRHSPKQDEVPLGIVAPGTLIGIGYDGVPELVTSAPVSVSRYRAELPGEKVSLLMSRLTEVQDARLKLTDKQGPKARLGDVHLVGGGLPEPHFTLETNSAGQVPTNGPLHVIFEFRDRAGAPLNLHVHNNVGAGVELRTPDGKVIDKATAKLAADKHHLEATVKVPDQEGSLTVHPQATVTTPEGTTFTSESEQSVIATKPAKLTCKPERLELVTKVGSFETTLTIGVEKSKSVLTGLTAELSDDAKGLRLIETTTKDNQIELHLEATATGIHRGAIVVTANSELLVEPLSVPYRIVAEPKSKGLNLTQVKDVRFGRVAANAGDVATSIELRSLDDESFDYEISVSDLSGPNGTVEVRCDPQSASPTTRSPATVKLTASVVNAVAGDYRGQLVVRDKVPELGREWKLDVTLNVTEPLSASPLEIGAVGVGQSITRNLRLSNRSSKAVKDITLVPPKQWSGTKGMTDEIELTVAEEPIELASKAERSFKLRVVVSPLAQVRGKFTADVIVRRGSVDALTIPVTLTVADQVPINIGVTPESLKLTGGADKVIEFTLKLRASADAEADEEVSLQVGAFQNADGSPVEITTDFSPESVTVNRQSSTAVKGFVIAPNQRGVYRGSVKVRSRQSGAKTIPLTIDVR